MMQIGLASLLICLAAGVGGCKPVERGSELGAMATPLAGDDLRAEVSRVVVQGKRVRVWGYLYRTERVRALVGTKMTPVWMKRIAGQAVPAVVGLAEQIREERSQSMWAMLPVSELDRNGRPSHLPGGTLGFGFEFEGGKELEHFEGELLLDIGVQVISEGSLEPRYVTISVRIDGKKIESEGVNAVGWQAGQRFFWRTIFTDEEYGKLQQLLPPGATQSCTKPIQSASGSAGRWPWHGNACCELYFGGWVDGFEGEVFRSYPRELDTLYSL